MIKNHTLMECYIEQNPHYPGVDTARIRGYGVSVWALIAYLQANGGDVIRTAADYALPLTAVEAAILYYSRHKHLIDAKIAANAA